jgi:CBS domain-containing protein
MEDCVNRLDKNGLDHAGMRAHPPAPSAAPNKTARKGERRMTVARILADKGRDVFTTQPHRTMKEVVELLASKGVGAVVVSDASLSVLGILSERDVVRVIARQGASALEDQVSRHMTPKVVTVTRDDTIEHVMQTMTAGRFRHLPVVEEGRLIGIISIGDVVKRHVGAIDSERQALREYIATA